MYITNFEQLSALGAGSVVLVLPDTTAWQKVDVNGTYVWVSDGVLRPRSPAQLWNSNNSFSRKIRLLFDSEQPDKTPNDFVENAIREKEGLRLKNMLNEKLDIMWADTEEGCCMDVLLQLSNWVDEWI